MDQRAFVQHWLRAVEGGNVGTLEEFPNRDLIAPNSDFSMAAVQTAAS